MQNVDSHFFRKVVESKYCGNTTKDSVSDSFLIEIKMCAHDKLHMQQEGKFRALTVTSHFAETDDNGLIEYDNGACYRGGVRNGAADGEGIYANGCDVVFKGEFVAGKLHGWARSSNLEFEFIETFYQVKSFN